MTKKIHIAIDAMGGDHGLSVTVPAALKSVNTHSNLNLTLVGDEVKIQAALKQYNNKSSNHISNSKINIQHASESIAMDELPRVALKNKRNSSMRVALNLVKKNIADACVSAGNTGALIAVSRYVLKMIKGVSRPVIVSSLPSQRGSVLMLDLGASVTVEAEQLLQFAVMGSILATTSNCPNPKVALLNVGSEVIKGHDTVRLADMLLREHPEINYTGFVEGNDIALGEVDVIVCDGFVGNIVLKALEGVAKMLLGKLKQSFQSNIYSKMAAMVAKPVLTDLSRQFNTDKYNGASLLGLKGIVIKSHGSASIDAFSAAIDVAMLEVENNIPAKIAAKIHDNLDDEDDDEELA